jgi:hypothetical protein
LRAAEQEASGADIVAVICGFLHSANVETECVAVLAGFAVTNAGDELAHHITVFSGRVMGSGGRLIRRAAVVILI